jgi:hypothetical protein
MTEKYNLCQQAFVLSLLSNQLHNLNGNKPDTKANLEARLAQFLGEFLPKSVPYLGTWEVVWGPAVFSVGGFPDNTTYIARKAGPSPIYLLATAGTNSASTFAKSDEDGQVQTTVAWTTAFREDLNGDTLLGDYGNPLLCNNPALSMGTAVGVRSVLETAPVSSKHDPNPKRLFEFLQGVQSKDATLIVTGHSLGGALSPVLALALFTPGGPLQKENWGQVYVLPTAGATPGNGDLAAGFAGVFPGIPGQPLTNPDPATEPLWNRNIANSFDFVPLAWVPEEMDKIKPPVVGKGGLYPHLSWDSPEARYAVRIGVGLAEDKARTGASSAPYGGTDPAGPYAPLPTITFTCAEIDPNASIKQISDYVHHWLLQHTVAYIQQIFKVDELIKVDDAREALSGAGAALLEPALAAEMAARSTRMAELETRAGEPG